MEETKRRHGLVTAYLWIGFVTCLLLFGLYLFVPDLLTEMEPRLPGWALNMMTVSMIGYAVCYGALLKWRKWGFWGLIVLGIYGSVQNYFWLHDLWTAALGLINIPITWLILQIGGERKVWTRLE